MQDLVKDKIEDLRSILDKTVNDGNLTSDEILNISAAMDELIMEYILCQ